MEEMFDKKGVYECIKDWIHPKDGHRIFTKGKLYLLEESNGRFEMQSNYGNPYRSWHFSQWLDEYREHFKYVGPYDFNKYGSMWYGYPRGVDDKEVWWKQKQSNKT